MNYKGVKDVAFQRDIKRTWTNMWRRQTFSLVTFQILQLIFHITAPLDLTKKVFLCFLMKIVVEKFKIQDL